MIFLIKDENITTYYGNDLKQTLLNYDRAATQEEIYQYLKNVYEEDVDLPEDRSMEKSKLLNIVNDYISSSEEDDISENDFVEHVMISYQDNFEENIDTFYTNMQEFLSGENIPTDVLENFTANVFGISSYES